MIDMFPDSKVHAANIGPTWVLSAPDGPHVGPMNLAIVVIDIDATSYVYIQQDLMIMLMFRSIFHEKKRFSHFIISYLDNQ